eukprot:539718_1
MLLSAKFCNCPKNSLTLSTGKSCNCKAMQEYLGPYQLTPAGNPKLQEDEVVLQNESSLSIYFGDSKKYRKGKCVLTTHRIFWTDTKTQRHAFHLKHVKQASTKSGFVGMSSPKIILYLNDREVVQKQANNLSQPKIIKKSPPKPGYIMLSFHSSGRDSFLKKLEKAMQSKAWHKQEEQKRNFSTQAAGIRGLMAQQQRKQEQQKKVVNEAFEDLESLMVHAKQMVSLANRLSKSTEAKEQANEFDTMLHGMGIISPVTKSVAGSEYHTLLARQLVDFLLKPLKRCGGMMTLTDIYCFYNKARGTQLVSPDDLLQSCRMMSNMGMPMRLKIFEKTGVMVLQLNEFNEENQTKKILELITNKCNNNGIDELRLSQLLNISINLGREQLLNAELKGFLCRDDSPSGLKFYKNVFDSYNKKMYWSGIKQLNVKINYQKNVFVNPSNNVNDEQKTNEPNIVNNTANKPKQTQKRVIMDL